MSRIGDTATLRALIKVLLTSFSGAFLGAVWVAYAALKFGDLSHAWLPLSALGAVAVCGMMVILPRPFFRPGMSNR